ncbi:MAG TPA: 2-deoxy-scyllo-inosose synthase [Ktedonobacteraceae bacterium]|nr:2-deoxy-scyllo-inosose synthase [Ktedonobacteraceae bacterium]
MSITIETPVLRLDRQIVWRNPDPPHSLFQFPYHLRSGDKSWRELQERLAQLQADRFLLISETGLPAPLKALVCERIGVVRPCLSLSFEQGERNKNILTLHQLIDAAIDAGATKASVVVALGGGLAGNVAGFLAGTLFRGIRFVHVPTTLLAASDSVISLKQGINSSFGKNHVGLFYAPAFVWSNLDLLQTLPRDETRAALCELIKNILAICPEYLEEVFRTLRMNAQYTPCQLARFIEICLEAKCSVMAEDALEKHRAIVLEYGHTIGHALELAVPGRLTHGLAVGLGMIVEATIAHLLGLLSEEDLEIHYRLLQANGAPTRIPAHEGYSTEKLFTFLEKDNKRGSRYREAGEECGHFDMVLLRGLGQPNLSSDGTVLTRVERAVIEAALAACR